MSKSATTAILTVPDAEAALMDREIGGLGVHFIRKLTDQLSYRREAGQNILRMELVLQDGTND